MTALFDAALNGPEPKAFVAKTFAVYVFPTINPPIDIGEDAPVAVNVAPLDESVAIAVKPVIAPPPTLEGAVKDIDPAVVSVPIVGASGTFNPL
jgi:hypothetical protein